MLLRFYHKKEKFSERAQIEPSLLCIFAADNVERFAELMVPDSLQPHKKMLKVIIVAAPLSIQTLGLFLLIYVILIHIRIGV